MSAREVACKNALSSHEGRILRYARTYLFIAMHCSTSNCRREGPHIVLYKPCGCMVDT